MSILDLTALELGKKIKAGEITSLQATEAVIKQIKAVEEQVHSYVTLDEEGAMKRAKEVQAQIEAGTLTGPLHLHFLMLFPLPALPADPPAFQPVSFCTYLQLFQPGLLQ